MFFTYLNDDNLNYHKNLSLLYIFIMNKSKKDIFILNIT